MQLLGNSSLGLPGLAPASLTGRETSGSRTDAKLQQARDAIAALQSLKPSTSANNARRAAAQDKLGRLKQRLKTLMMMGGDPKVIARQVAKIAKDIAEAAKAYAAAGGKDPAMMAQAPAPSPPTAPPAQPVSNTAQEVTTTATMDAPKASPAAALSLNAEDPFMREAKDMVKTARDILERELRKARQKDRSDLTLDKLEADGAQAVRDVDKAANDLKFANEMSTASYAPSAAGVVNVAVPAAPAVVLTA